MNLLLENIEKGLKDYESSKFRPFMLLILIILNHPTDKMNYIDRIVSILENAFRHNSSYFFEIDIINQWIYLVNI
jgi:hypothetical protein